mgnify:CR=1 FL=1
MEIIGKSQISGMVSAVLELGQVWGSQYQIINVGGTNTIYDKGYENNSVDAMERWHMQSACMYDL